MVTMRHLLYLASICASTEILCPKECQCTKRSAVCDDLELDSLEAVEFGQSTEKLSLLNNSFVELQPELFTGLTNLVSVEVRNNDISAVRAFTFANMANVEFIAIEHNPMLNYVDQKGVYRVVEILRVN